MTKRIGLWHIGSFKYHHRFESENPLEEVWSRVARYSAIDYLKSNLHPEKKDIDWNKHIKYAAVRIKQSVEFRNSAKNTTLLTSPLLLYYSFLNLTRACLALGPEVMPSSYHGLTFKKGKDLLSSGANITSGTFTDYLSSFNIPWKKGTVVTLRDSFSRIIEMHHDFRTIKGNSSYVVPVSVKAYTNGPIYIDLLIPYDDFPEKWEHDFPKLKQLCELDANGKSLIISDKVICESYESISKCINSILFPYLIYNDSSSLWFLIREVDQSLIFPRASYYYLAMFILGSIVRYEPDLMLKSSQMDSEIGWLLNRFIQAAERFFPQLKLWEQFNTTVYF